jgi:hypothetical protein
MATRVLLALLLIACAQLPAAARPAEPSELRAIEAAHAAFVDARGPTPLGPLERVLVVPSTADELEASCLVRAHACVYTVERYVGAPLSTLIYVRDDAPPRMHASLVQHEAAHVLRAQWVVQASGAEYLARLRHGSREGCEIARYDDPGHCDSELWVEVLDDAAQRLGRLP